MAAGADACHPGQLDAMRGFTLLETLVVLVLVSLLSVLMVQGLSHALMLRERVLDLTQFQREDALRRGWFQDTAQGLLADLERIEDHQFTGTSERFSGYSLAPLLGPPGAPAVIEWRLEQTGELFRLYYRQQDAPPRLTWEWRTDQAEFVYFAPEVGWVSQWPPAQLDGTSALPAVVALQASWRGDRLTWAAPTRVAPSPRDDLVPIELRF